MFNDPEEFPFGAMSPESVVLEITRSGNQFGPSWSFTVSIHAMTGEAGTFAVVKRFTLFNHFRRIREGTREGSSFSQLIGRHSRLHHVAFGFRERSHGGHPYRKDRDDDQPFHDAFLLWIVT
jgi:hypothetical protein